MATHAFGTRLKWNANYVASINSINGIELSVETVDVTTHDSPDSYKETIAGLIEAGDVGIEGFFKQGDSNGQLAMLADLNARTPRPASIIFPASTGTTWSFTGLITALKIGDAPVDGAIPFTATIKPAGKPTLAVSVSTGLSGFSISDDAVIAPTPSGSTYDYVATVLSDVDSVTVTPTAANGVIKVNGNTVESGVASSAIALGASGSITTVVITVTEENKAPRAYTIRIVRAAI